MDPSHSLGVQLGYEPFDFFLVDKWDPACSLSQDEQERELVKAWIGLGRRGRSHYYRQSYNNDISSVDHIPSNLSVFEKRKTTDPDNWSGGGAIWIRTWYGNEASLRDTSVEEKEIVTRTRADEAYLRLWQKALYPPQDNYEFDEKMFGPFVFDDNNAAYGVGARDADDEVELMDEIPSFISNALMRCPDAMDGSRLRSIIENEEDEEDYDRLLYQDLLVVVADREACEEGWVLLIALNHKGQVLHTRARCKAYRVSDQVYEWRHGGEPLNYDQPEGTENIMDYKDMSRSGDGWDEDEPF